MQLRPLLRKSSSRVRGRTGFRYLRRLADRLCIAHSWRWLPRPNDGGNMPHHGSSRNVVTRRSNGILSPVRRLQRLLSHRAVEPTQAIQQPRATVSYQPGEDETAVSQLRIKGLRDPDCLGWVSGMKFIFIVLAVLGAWIADTPAAEISGRVVARGTWPLRRRRARQWASN